MATERPRYRIMADVRATPPTLTPLTPAPTNKVPTGLTSKGTIARDPRPIGQQLLRLGGTLKPRDISAICARADNGYMQMLCDLGDDSRQRDNHLASILHRRENAIGGVPYQVIPATDRPRAIRIAAFVESVLRSLGDDLSPDGEELFDFRRTLVHLNGAIFYGYGITETLWKKAGRYIQPSGTIPMSPRRFIYSINGVELRWWDESGSAFPYPGKNLLRDFPMGRFLVHRPRINGSVGPREGFARPLIWSSYFRTWTLGDWFREGELAAKPYRIGRYEDNAQPEDLLLLDQALEALTSNGWTRIPKSLDLIIEYAKGSKGGTNIHEALAVFLAGEESKLVLGSTLTSEQGRTGAMALGIVHADVTSALLELDARALEGTIRRLLIVPLVRRNFGMNAPIPDFRFLTEEGANLAVLATAIDKLLKSGLRIPARWLRATFGIPEPELGEELANGGIAKSVGEEPKPASVPSPAEPNADDDGADDDLGVSEKDAARLTRAFHAHAILAAAGVRRFTNLHPNVLEMARHQLA